MVRTLSATGPRRWIARLIYSQARVLSLVLLLLTSACGVEVKPLIEDPTQRAVDALDQLISRMENQSEDWQDIVDGVIKTLPEEVHKIIGNDLTQLMNRGVAALGVEARCEVDFLRSRIKWDLIRLKAQLLKEAVGEPEPWLCVPVPSAVDMSLEPNQRNKVDFYGFDLDSKKPIQVFLEDDGQITDVTAELHHQTHYQMLLNLGGNGVHLTSKSEKLILKWGEAEISTIPILQVDDTPPQCQITKDRTTVHSQKLTPELINGDHEFKRNGPRVVVSVNLTQSATRLKARIEMHATETRGGDTAAYVSKEVDLYTAPPGKKIQSIYSDLADTLVYTDSNLALDSHGGSVTGPVSKFQVIGDTSGNDVGETQVEVFFRSIEVELIDGANCVAPAAFKALQSTNPALQQRIRMADPVATPATP